jgi:hypothetical protein
MENEYSLDTAMRFARSGALVRIVVAEDACQVCKALSGRIHIPSEVPRLPIRGCLHDQCRCTFVAVDPETKQSVPEMVQLGIRAIREGQTDRARRTLRRAVALDETYELGWLWLSGVVDDDLKIVCLEKVLDINPHNQRARAGLELLHQKLASPQPAESAKSQGRSAPTPVAPPPQGIESGPEVMDLRQERQVILGQWTQFLGFAINTDAQILLIQGRAFVHKLADLWEQTLEVVSPEMRREELQLQKQELSEMMGALADASRTHRSKRQASLAWQDMDQAMGRLARRLLDLRETLQAQLSAAGDSVPLG